MPSLKTNSLINSKYKIIHFIERTSFCEIYTAENIDLKEQICLNVYNAAKISRDDLDKEGALREIGFLKMSIKGFPKYIDDGTFQKDFDSYRYIATQMIGGESVMDRIKRTGPYDEFDAIITINQLLEIANVIHSFKDPILFNGLSLDNLMIDMSGPSEQIIIRNIINVRFMTNNFKYKYIDGVNSNYLAPEVFNNVFSAKTDIFNIGAIFYHLVSGTAPWFVEISSKEYFSDDSIDKIFEAREKLLIIHANIDEHLKLTIAKSLALDVDNRFNSVTDFKEALAREKLLTSPNVSKEERKRKKEGNGLMTSQE